MPEGHTLHALARDLHAAYAGTAPQVSSPQGRFAAGAAVLDARPVVEATAWGKQLFVEFDGERMLHVHLGLIGKFSVTAVGEAGPPPVRGAVRLRLATDQHVADLRGPIVCAVVTPEEVAAVVAGLGPDPLRPDADPDAAWTRLSRSRRSVAELLMDQSVLAGVGNVYRSEVLFRHRIGPHFPGNRIKRHTWQAIWDDLVTLMPIGMATGRIVTDEEDLSEVIAALRRGEPVSPERRYAVYRRAGEPCRRCGARVRTKVVAGRNLFWCGSCQRRT